jgi:hypothetical protein
MSISSGVTKALRNAGLIATAAVFVTATAVPALHAQSIVKPAQAKRTAKPHASAKKMADKKTTVRNPQSSKPQSSTGETGSAQMQGYRPDPVSNY